MRARRCKQIIEIIDIDPTTKEILTNEVFHWNPIEDKFIYTGKSYVLEGIRARWDLTKEEITKEIRQRAEILKWMHNSDIRTYREVAKAISRYAENPDGFLKKMRHPDKKEREKKKDKKDKDWLPSFTDDLAELKKKYSEKLIVSDLGIKVDAFKAIESVDDETAVYLYDNGFTSIEDLKNATAKDLIKIKGIKRKKAKRIIKELSDSSSKELSQVSDDRGEMGAVK
jgi:uncharacterized membrane-anchored protein YhcB (DUF1043 family)